MTAVRPRPTRTHLVPALAGLLALTGLLAACSGGEEPAGAQTSAAASTTATAESTTDDEPYAGMEPAQILQQAAQSIDDATSVRVQAKVDVNGETVSIDLSMNRSAEAKGTVATESQGSMKLIRIGDTGWFLPGDDMLEKIADGDDAVQDYLRGKWLKFTKGGDMDQNFTLTDMDTMLGKVVAISDASGTIVTVKGTTFSGVKTIGLKQKGTVGVVFVAADGSGEVVAARDADGTLTFSDWNTEVTVKKPTKVLSQKKSGD